MTITELAAQLNRDSTPDVSNGREHEPEPLSVEWHGDKLVITVDCSPEAQRNARSTQNGNKMLASSWDLPDARKGWFDAGNGVGLNLAVTHRERRPAASAPRYRRYTPARQRWS